MDDSLTAGHALVSEDPAIGPDEPQSGYARELSELRRVLDESPVAGRPRRDAELAELRRLVARYPDEAREILRDSGAGDPH